MGSENQLEIRPARKADLQRINSMARASGMSPVQNVSNVYVGEIQGYGVVSYVKLTFGRPDGICHVNPIVVDRPWRRLGLGKRLILFLLDRYGEVRLVARGESEGFYERLGFENVGWEQIYDPVASECDTCSDREDCRPRPMGRRG